MALRDVSPCLESDPLVDCEVLCDGVVLCPSDPVPLTPVAAEPVPLMSVEVVPLTPGVVERLVLVAEPETSVVVELPVAFTPAFPVAAPGVVVALLIVVSL